ncbi:MAG: molecular chaperone DnaJ [Phycisphaerales bacterium]
MINAVFRPLEKPIPLPKGGVISCPFSCSFTTTLDDLERELFHLKAKDIVIELDLDLQDIRNDGWPRSTARPRTQGVRLSFDSKHGPLSYTCATYGHWERNLRAVGLTLDRLRAVDRYGAVKGGEQYKGWAALPPPPQPAAGGDFASIEEAMRFLCKVGNGTVLSVLPSDLEAVYRDAARKAHPDAGGSTELMARVNAAKAFVEAHL